MRHELSCEGVSLRLRPVRLEDSELIVRLRTDPERARFLHETSSSIEEQRAWTRRYFDRLGDYYFVVERSTGAPEGVVGIYDLDETARTAEWGRWVLQKGSAAAIESAMLVYRVAFGALDLESVYCRTLEENEQVVSFHQSCGLATRRRIPAHASIRGHDYAAIEQVLARADWPPVDARLLALSRALARRSR